MQRADPLAGLTDAELIARVLAAEAGGEGEEGMLAAGAVMRNRLQSGRWGTDWRSVLTAPGQFSALNAYTGYAGGAGANDVWTRPAPEAARRVAGRLLAGAYDDPTGGALHFYAPAGMPGGQPPKWAEGRETVAIGGHRFLPERGGSRQPAATNGRGATMPMPMTMRGGAAKGGPPDLTDTSLTPRDRIAAALMAGGQALQGLSRGTGIDATAGFRLANEMQTGKQGRAARNETLEYLRQRDPDLAQMVASGALKPKEALDLMQQQQGAQGGIDKDRIAAANTLRDDVRTDLATVNLVRDGAQTIKTLYTNPGAVSDYALAVAFAKIVDPGSVAREGEVAAVQRSGALFPALASALQNAFTGQGGMPAEQRNEIARLAVMFANQQLQGGRQKLDGYRRTAEAMGVPFEWVWQGGDLADMEIVSPPTPSPSGGPTPVAPGGNPPALAIQPDGTWKLPDGTIIRSLTP